VRGLERAARRRIVVVTGRRGSGKSIALSAFAASTGAVTYVVREEHDTAAAFARGLVEALAHARPDLLRTLSAAYAGVRRRERPWDALTDWLADQLTGPLTIVVDQFERASSDDVARFLTRVVDRSPGVRWVLGMRASDAFPIARWLAEQLVDVSIDDDALRVDASDVPSLAGDFGCSRDEIERLRRRYRGSVGAIAAALGNVEATALTSEEERRHARVRAGQFAERAGAHARALQWYVAAKARDDVLRLLDDRGFDLLDSGWADVVGSAVDVLGPEHRRRSAVALTLAAADESYRGRYDVSEAWFQHALELASDDQRARVDMAYAIDLLRRNRPDAIERLETIAEHLRTPAHAATVMGSLATAYARAGRFDAARTAVSRALASLDDVGDLDVQATVHHRAAYVAVEAGDYERAETHAETATRLAREHGNDELVAIARSVSYVVAVSFRDDHQRALAVLEETHAAGARLGSTLFVRFAVFGAYLIHAERGDRAALAELDAAIAGTEFESSLEQIEEGLLPVRALRQTWTGDFAGAYNTIAPSGEHDTLPEIRALRWAEIALYAAAAGYRDTASAAIATARSALRATGGEASVDLVRTRLWLALASLALGRRGAARLLLERVAPDLERFPRWAALHRTVTALAYGAQRAEAAEVLARLDDLRLHGFGGFAATIAMMPTTCFDAPPRKRRQHMAEPARAHAVAFRTIDR